MGYPKLGLVIKVYILVCNTIAGETHTLLLPVKTPKGTQAE